MSLKLNVNRAEDDLLIVCDEVYNDKNEILTLEAKERDEFVDFSSKFADCDDIYTIGALAIESGTNEDDTNPDVKVFNKLTDLTKDNDETVPNDEPQGRLDDYDIDRFDIDVPLQKRAITYSFELDHFQKRSIYRLHRNENCLLCAHTGSGKTVVAEYAIALCKQRNLRAIYTSPIKALSNQKYSEFIKLFDDVGIITGDVNINSNAQCIIMTTEILRNLLYRNDPVLGEVGAVIFDEIHYITDQERGTVWEECIILLPSNVTLVMLSASIQNYMHFANWVAKVKKRDIFVTITERRAVPLIHSIVHNNKEYILLDKNGEFNMKAFRAIYDDAAKLKKEANLKNEKAQKEKNRAPQQLGNFKKTLHVSNSKTAKAALQKFVVTLIEKDALPAVVFCFSRARVEQAALSLSPLSCFTKDEQHKTMLFFNNSISKLSEADRKVPQVQMLATILQKGIAIHHGGLLPLLKEIVEMLISRRLIKLLFATETFAMGINMPMRSAVLIELEKTTGNRKRFLKVDEYTQMAGRAGRRGLDDVGRVFILSYDRDPPDQAMIIKLLTNKPAGVESSFRLTIKMALELRTRNFTKPENLFSRSLRESYKINSFPSVRKLIVDIDKQITELSSKEFHVTNSSQLVSMAADLISLSEFAYDFFVDLSKHKSLQSLLSSFRLITIYNPDLPYIRLPALIIDCQNTGLFSCIAVLDCSLPLINEYYDFLKLFTKDKLSIERISELYGIQGSTTELVFLQKLSVSNIFCVYDKDYKCKLDECVAKGFRRCLKSEKKATLFGDSSSSCDYYDLSSGNFEWGYLPLVYTSLLSLDLLGVKRVEILDQTEYNDIDLLSKYLSYEKQLSLVEEHEALTDEVSIMFLLNELRIGALKRQKCKYLSQISPLTNSINQDYYNYGLLLAKYGYLTDEFIPTLKGRAAIEIMTRDELALAESFFNNSLLDLDTAELGGFVALFAGQHVFEEDPLVSMRNTTLRFLESVVALHDSIGQEISSLSIPLDTDYWNRVCCFASVNIGYCWASKVELIDIVKVVSMGEGTIVQVILRIIDMTKKLRGLAHALDNTVMEEKFTELLNVISRGIVFTECLYLKDQSKSEK